MNTIMVQICDLEWTHQAVHLACAMARNQEAEVALVRMVPVQQMTWVGTDLARIPMSQEEHQLVDELQATAEDYGVKLSLRDMQYFTLKEALVEIAEALASTVIFATLPVSSLPYWRQFQMWSLQRQLNRRGCHLFTLEQTEGQDVKPSSVTVQPSQQVAHI